MKRAVTLIPLAVLALFVGLPGCETVTETSGQNGNKIARTIQINAMQLPDDTEMLLLLDRPTWLSRKPMPDY